MRWWLYFIQTQGVTPARVKIGISRNPLNRLATLEICSPFEFSLRGVIACASKFEALELERELHSRFSSLRARGEWFDSSVLYDLSDQCIIDEFSFREWWREAI